MSDLGEQLIEIVRRKAGQQPFMEYVPELRYVGNGINVPDSCKYMHDDGPGCIIGHALFEAGLIDGSLRDDPDGLNCKVLEQLAETLELPLDEDELDWLCRVQGFQDAKQTWGNAVEFADERDAVLA